MITHWNLRLRDKLLAILFPSRCLICGKVCCINELFCPACRKKLPANPCTRYFLLPQELAVYAPLVYEGGFRHTLHSFKFQGEKLLSEPIGQLMASALPHAVQADLVTYVPMTLQKQKERGYNQSERLAKAVAHTLNLPCNAALRKIKETATQHDLTREERLKNPVGAYYAGTAVAGKTVLLIDDIVTTGSTISECASALYRAGAAAVVGLCAASAEWKGETL